MKKDEMTEKRSKESIKGKNILRLRLLRFILNTYLNENGILQKKSVEDGGLICRTGFGKFKPRFELYKPNLELHKPNFGLYKPRLGL